MKIAPFYLNFSYSDFIPGDGNEKMAWFVVVDLKNLNDIPCNLFIVRFVIT